MNILLPILTNLIILGILTASVFIGKRNGFRVEFIKFILVVGSCVGLYFLNPIVVNLLLKIEFTQFINYQLLSSLSLLSLFIISYLIITLIVKSIKTALNKRRGINPIKHNKIKGLDRKATRELRREERRLNRIELKKKSQAFGIIFGLLIGIIFGFAIMLPIKYTTEQYNYSAAYEYTLYGQLDNIVELSEFVIGE